MSYNIEAEKAVFALTPPAEDKRFPSYDGQLALYATSSCCNNVYPQIPHWDAIALDSFRVWNYTAMLPMVIWEMAHHADGGSIKPGNRNVTGTAYIKQWKDAVGAPRGLDGFPLRCLSLWEEQPERVRGRAPMTLAQVAEMPADSPLWGQYPKLYGAKLHAALHSLLEGIPMTGMRTNLRLSFAVGSPRFWDALFLFRNREGLPFSVNLCQ